MILLNPGPTNTLDIVKKAQWEGSDICHRNDDFLKMMGDTKQQLLNCFSPNARLEDWHVAIIGGSGTVALEAMVLSLLNDDNVTVINAGAYGQRVMDILKCYKVSYDEVKCLNISELKFSSFSQQLYFVQHETSSGEDFSVADVKQNFPKARFYIDATSAFGAIDYTPYLEQIDAISFCSNKCLQSTPGLGLVIWRKELVLYQRSYYSDLSKYTELMSLPFTVPTQSVYALNKSLSLRQASLEHEYDFNRKRDKLIDDFLSLGIKCLNYNPSNVIIGFEHPSRDFNSLQSYLLEEGIIIYSSLKGIKNSFRIATISVLFEEYYEFFIEKFHNSL